jgi:hypothetical protein
MPRPKTDGDEGVRSLASRTPPVTWWHTLDHSVGDPTSDRKGLDIQALLNDLYASEINASISWIWDGGVHATLGAPPIEEGTLPTIRDAVLWLRDKECEHFPDSDFAR